MNNAKIKILYLIISLSALSLLGQGYRNPFALKESEIPKLRDEAIAGDYEAARKLAFHYDYTSEDSIARGKAVPWYFLMDLQGSKAGLHRWSRLLYEYIDEISDDFDVSRHMTDLFNNEKLSLLFQYRFLKQHDGNYLELESKLKKLGISEKYFKRYPELISSYMSDSNAIEGEEISLLPELMMCGDEYAILRAIGVSLSPSNRPVPKYYRVVLYIASIFRNRDVWNLKGPLKIEKIDELFLMMEAEMEKLENDESLYSTYIQYRYWIAKGDKEKAKPLLEKLKTAKIDERLLKHYEFIDGKIVEID